MYQLIKKSNIINDIYVILNMVEKIYIKIKEDRNNDKLIKFINKYFHDFIEHREDLEKYINKVKTEEESMIMGIKNADDMVGVFEYKRNKNKRIK